MNTIKSTFYLGLYTLAGIISFLLLATQSVFAQTSEQLPDSNTDTSPSGVVNCFDYYTFGSVQVSVVPLVSAAYTTDTILFAGNVANNNPYPITDGQIWMKVFKVDQESPELLKENGYPLVDFVLIEDEISMTANSQQPIEFGWTAPAYAAEGDYMVAFFFTTAHRYNLLGLSFTDDVVGNTANFEIKRTTPYTPVVFDKNSVHVNDTKTSFALPPRRFNKDNQMMAYATLVNDSDVDRRVELTWTAYKWDGIYEVFKKDTKTEVVQIPANDTLEVGYDTPVLDTAVTFVQAEVKDGDAKSMLHIRYVREGVEETRINFPSIFTYPLVAGEEATVFSCAHSTNLPVVPDNNLTLTLRDVNNNILHTYTYEGDISGAMMGFADSFTPERDYGSFSLTASLMRGGELVEEVTTVYDCESLNSDFCTEADKKIAVSGVFSDFGTDRSSTLPIIIFLIIFGLGVVLIIIDYLKKNKDYKEEGDLIDSDYKDSAEDVGGDNIDNK